MTVTQAVCLVGGRGTRLGTLTDNAPKPLLPVGGRPFLDYLVHEARRFGARPADGVVDSEHRVFGVPNLYVVDGSVLPTQGSANPALTIMALAARCADHLILASRSGVRPSAAR